ncbi:MAG: putative fructoselysine transporter [Methanomassiliicoccales archaeon PtaU1.Bin124]|nr:MAG: putative fructoselysine transporter [Methanomassiliicoccales archaeon PtaU1.Bin124]
MASDNQGGTFSLTRKLNTFDVTNLVVGSIIGADIYIATGLAAGLVGPAALVAWVLAGVMAMVIALSFAYCVTLLPRVGGPYAYVKDVSTPFAGFMVGWSLLLAEWFSLAVFPVAFAQYFTTLVPGIDAIGVVLLKGLFILFIMVTNIISIKAAGRANDVLTIIKLSPLVLIIMAGLVFMLSNPSTVGTNTNPFFTGDAMSFGSALVLIFWAYAGFELSTLPADEVDKPQRTIPKAIVLGMLIVIAFYLLTNLVVVGSVAQQTLIDSSTPLIDTGQAVFGGLGVLSGGLVLLVGIGALFSIMGADESGTIGTSRLTYAMSIDGLLPHSLARTGKKGGAPYIAIIVLCSTAFIVSVVGGLAALINASVFLLAFVYLSTCLSTIWLIRKYPERAEYFKGKRLVPLAGAAFSLMLIFLTDPVEIAVSLVLLAVGVPIYTFFSPKKEMAEARAVFHSTEAVLARTAAQSTRFLAHPLLHIKLFIYRRRNIQPAFKYEKK